MSSKKVTAPQGAAARGSAPARFTAARMQQQANLLRLSLATRQRATPKGVAGKAARKKEMEARVAAVAEAAGLDSLQENKEDPAAGARDSEESDGEASEEAAREAAEYEAALTARIQGKCLAVLETMQARINALEADNARLSDVARQTAEQVALQAEQDEDTGEQARTGEEEQRAPVTTAREGAGAKPVQFSKTAFLLPEPSSSAPPQHGVTQVMHIPMPARPATLAYPALEKTLETWCMQQRAWFRAVRLPDGVDQLVQAVASMDAQLQSWWGMQSEAESARSFNVLEATLLATFIRQDAVERALAQLRDVRMLQSEDAHQYFLRVEELRVRARVADDDRVALATVLERFDQSRWPIAAAHVAREWRAGRITRISALRKLLVAEVLCEPKLTRAAQQNPPPRNEQPRHLNSLPVEAGAEVAAMEVKLAEMARQLAAVQARGPAAGAAICARCGKSGHWHAECREPDKRECYKCHKTGHVRRNCPEGAPAKEGDSQQPLNQEARQ